MNTSLVSPFNTNFLLALGQQPSPSPSEEREELFGDSSLGMLSEVAKYHGELYGMDLNSTAEASMHKRLANIQFLSVNGEWCICWVFFAGFFLLVCCLFFFCFLFFGFVFLGFVFVFLLEGKGGLFPHPLSGCGQVVITLLPGLLDTNIALE